MARTRPATSTAPWFGWGGISGSGVWARSVDTFFVMSECTLTADKERGRPLGKMFDFTFVWEREMMKCSPCHSAHESSIYTRTARACCWLVPSAIPRIHPSVGPSHTIMLSNKIVPFLSRTLNTTDSIHASRWPHPSPRFLLAGHKVRSQWRARDSQQFCAMERSGTVFPRVSARLGPPEVGPGRDQLTGAKTYFDS